MSVQEIDDCLTVNLSQILGEVEFFAEERLCHDGQVDWIDELEAHCQVLDFIDQVHRDFLCLTQEKLVVLLLVLLLSQFEVGIVDYVLFIFSPDSNLLLSFRDMSVATKHLVANDQNAAVCSKHHLKLVGHEVHSMK